MWVAWLLAGCWMPTETGPKGMVGRVVDVGGLPLAGVDVMTLEERVPTDAEGGFAIQYKPPETFVNWSHGGAWYRRVFRPEDQGKVLEIRLPALRDVDLFCEVAPPAGVTAQPCARVELAWDLGDGLFAKADVACGRIPTRLVAVPVGAPTATCGVPVRVAEEHAGLVVRPPSTPVRVEIRADEGLAPRSCVIRIGDRLASPMEGGFYTAEAAGRVQVGGACDGRPLFPRWVDAAEGSVALDWSASGPSLDLAGLPVPAGSLRLIREIDGATLEVAAGADGVYLLPPLPEGRYRFGVGDPAALATLSPPAVVPPGAMRILAQVPTTPGNPGGLAGVLVLAADFEEGKLPVVLAVK